MRAKLAFLVLTACLAGLSGCEWEDFGATRFSRDFHYSFPLQSGGKVSVETFNGPVDVTGWDQPTVEIDGAKYGSTPEAADAVRVDITHTATAIEIHVNRPYDLRGNLGARFSLKMPRKAILDRVESSNGPIVVQGATGPARLRTSNGSIRVENFDGSLDAHTSNGGIDLAYIGGEAVASTTNGHIQAENLKGTLDATTSNSSITVNLSGARLSHPVRLETSNSPVDVTLPAGFENGARISTSNAPIAIRMPAGSNARVLARTNNASISSDFEVKVEGVVNKNILDGPIGTGGPLLDLTTSNAPIRLLRL